MTPICPHCGSTDVHSSRAKGAMDGLARTLGLPPRRCSACGWRGYRPRFLYPSRHGSNPEARAVEPPAAQPPAAAAPPVPVPAPEPEAESRGRRRHHRHRHHIKSKSAAAWKIALLAAALGAILGYVVLGMEN